MAEACQRGPKAGVDHVVFGRNEALSHHLSAEWQGALADHQRLQTGVAPSPGGRCSYSERWLDRPVVGW